MIRKFLQKYGLFIVAILIVVSPAIAGTIHTFANGEALTAANLNQPLQHIHNTMVGGHGARLVDADVSASAAITHSKLKTPSLVPKAWATVNFSAGCVSVNGACSESSTGVVYSQVTSITRTGTGVYQVVLSYTPANTGFAVIVGTEAAATPAFTSCTATSKATSSPHFLIQCADLATPSAANAGFDFVVMDNDNY